MYGHLEENGILPEEQKGCKRKCRGTKDQLLIDKVILRDCKKWKTNLAMSWIDYRKDLRFDPTFLGNGMFEFV